MTLKWGSLTFDFLFTQKQIEIFKRELGKPSVCRQLDQNSQNRRGMIWEHCFEAVREFMVKEVEHVKSRQGKWLLSLLKRKCYQSILRHLNLNRERWEKWCMYCVAKGLTWKHTLYLPLHMFDMYQMIQSWILRPNRRKLYMNNPSES